MKTLETERLIMRPFEETDLEDLYQYAKNPNIGPNAGWQPHQNKEQTRGILNMFMQDNDVWALVYKGNNELIGSVGLHNDRLRSTDDIKMLGYVLSEAYWGRGLVTEASKAALAYAFEELKVNLVSVHHYPFNHQSKRVIEKCGFIYEGTLRHATKLYDGSIYDLMCYSMTKEEWSKHSLLNSFVS